MTKKELKRKISMAMAVAMAMSVMVMPVSAEEKGMPVQYGKTTEYTLSIPASITLSDSATVQTKEVGVRTVNTTPTEKVLVKIKDGITNGKVTLTRENDSTKTTVVSTVTGKNNAEVGNGFVVGEFQDTSTGAFESSNGGELNFSAISNSSSEKIIKAGNYVGTITFEGEVVKRN